MLTLTGAPDLKVYDSLLTGGWAGGGAMMDTGVMRFPMPVRGGLSPLEPFEFFPLSLKFRVGFPSPEQAPRYPELYEPVFIRVLHSLGVNMTVFEPRWMPLYNGVKQCPQLQRSTQSHLQCVEINVGKRWVDRASKGSGAYHPVHGPQRAVGAQPAQKALPRAFRRREELENKYREEGEEPRNSAYHREPLLEWHSSIS